MGAERATVEDMMVDEGHGHIDIPQSLAKYPGFYLYLNKSIM